MAIQKPSHTFTKIHLKALRTNIFHILFALSFTVFMNTFSYAQDIPKKTKPVKVKVESDTLKSTIDSIVAIQKPLREQDTIKIDTIPKKKGMIESIVKYSATDYVSFNRKEQKTYLYNNAKVTYLDMEITAGIIVINHENNEVYAGRLKDSLGNYTQAPVFKQGADLVEPDSIRFNFNTEKALIWNSRTEQSGGYIIAEKLRKKMIRFTLLIEENLQRLQIQKILSTIS